MALLPSRKAALERARRSSILSDLGRERLFLSAPALGACSPRGGEIPLEAGRGGAATTGWWEPSWHRRQRQRRASARVALQVAAQQLRHHHGSAVPKEFEIAMPGGDGDLVHVDAATRRKAAAAGRAARDAAYANVLANAARARSGSRVGVDTAKGGSSRGGGAKGKPQGPGGKNSGKASNWRCNVCGEPSNFQHRETCYVCRAPRGGVASGKSKAGSKGKARGQQVSLGKGLGDRQPQSLRPHVGSKQDGPIGADGKRPLLGRYIAYLEEQHRKGGADSQSKGKGEGEKADEWDPEGFVVVKRATKTWPRVGGSDGPAAKQASTSTVPVKPNLGEARAKGTTTAAPTDLGGKGGKGSPGPPAPNAAAASLPEGKGRPVPARPPWADQCDDADEDDEDFDEDLFGDGPGGIREEEDHMDDDEMHDLDDGCDEWAGCDDEDGDHGDRDADDAQADQQEVDKLEKAWRTKKGIFESVAWRHWQGDPEFEDAREQRDQAYEEWQAAKKAVATPKLATVHQRKQKAVDRARRRVESRKHAMEQALEKHHDYMRKELDKLRQEQLRLEEAEANLQQFILQLQVADHAEGARKEHDEEPIDQAAARGQVATARRGLETIKSQLQELFDQLEEQGNFLALDQINSMYGSLAGAVGGVEEAEQLLAKKPKTRWNRAQYYAIDGRAQGEGEGRDPPPPSGTGDGNKEGENAEGRRGTGGEGPKVSTSSSSKPSGPPGAAAADGTHDEAKEAASGAEQRQREADAKPVGGAQEEVIRFGGAADEQQEEQLLQAEAERALDQAQAKFADADKGPNTDNAALLFAHQCVLGKVGTPTTLAEVRAFERWRKALGGTLERLAAERFRAGGAYW